MVSVKTIGRCDSEATVLSALLCLAKICFKTIGSPSHRTITPRTPLEELTALPETPIADGEGKYPVPKNPNPFGFWPLHIRSLAVHAGLASSVDTRNVL